MEYDLKQIHTYVERYINNTFTNSIDSYMVALGEKTVYDVSFLSYSQALEATQGFRFKENGYIYITDKTGRILSHPEKNRIGAYSVVRSWIMSTGKESAFRKYHYNETEKYLYKIYSEEHDIFFIISCYVSDFTSLVNLNQLRGYINEIIKDQKMDIYILDDKQRVVLHPGLKFGTKIDTSASVIEVHDGFFITYLNGKEISGLYSENNFFNWTIAVLGSTEEILSRYAVMKDMFKKFLPTLSVFILSISIIFLKLIFSLKIQQKNLELINTQKELLYKLGETVETRSKETSTHVKRVSFISEFIARKLNLKRSSHIIIKSAAPLHDIGKIGIPDGILNKPGKLTSEEYDMMKQHTTIGYNILKGSEKPLLKASATIAYEHHECWDGSGYPRGLKGEEIHIFARIINVADVIDALLSKRVYKDAWPEDKVYKHIEDQKGKMFDPKIVEVVLNNWDRILKIIKSIKETEELYNY